MSTLKVASGDICEGLVSLFLDLLVAWREEATDPTTLPAGVGHEEGVDDTHALPRPAGAERVLVHTTFGVAPATCLGTRGLHEVKHALARHSAVVLVVLADDNVQVQPTAVVSLPPPAELAPVLTIPGSAVPAWSSLGSRGSLRGQYSYLGTLAPVQ